ncbi:MAG TPA: GspE/PulE family protein [Vicinamibacterales bacterium]|nr:GspE/PulE family protein [Vicinamibacterales bacterium]
MIRNMPATPATTTSPKTTPPMRPSALGELLLERELITKDQLAAAISHQRLSGRRLGQVLIDLGCTTPDAVLGALSIQQGVAATRLNGYTVSPAAVQALPEKVARKYLAVPLQKIGTMLHVAIANPKDLDALDDIRFASGCQIQTHVALEDEIPGALDRFYTQATLESELDGETSQVLIEPVRDRRDPTRPDRRLGIRGRRLSDAAEDEFDEATEETAVRAVDRILTRAGAAGASDIHLERMSDTLRVRFRVDGTFQDIGYISSAIAPAITARLKVLGGMDIAEHRVPQDGRLTVKIGTRRLDFRASTYPTIHGEKVVLRVLDQQSLRLDLASLGVHAPMIDQYRELIRRPEGLILITGPTGSGKTSTLYASLGELVEGGKNITTIENPVEYEVQGINQGQINEKAGFTFAKGLRAVLRQDPDVIMVGEIRDSDTLTTAVEASLTGHLVFSTLHTNSAIGTITRLLDMGIEPYFLASGVLAIVAQRLVRQICTNCSTTLPVPAGVAHLFGDNVPELLRRGAGCADCRGTGFSGRKGIYEMVRMTPALRELILARASEATLLVAAREDGTASLREQCLARVREGSTTLEEVVRVTQ